MKKLLIFRIIAQSLISVLLTGIIIFIALWSYSEAKKELVTSFSRYTLATAKNNANSIEEKFSDLRLLFDYIADEIKIHGISERSLRSKYFENVYSSIAEDFVVFAENGDILYRGDKLFLDGDTLRQAFLETLIEEKGLPTPRISEYKLIDINNKQVGIFLYFKQILYTGMEHDSVFLTFIISEERILNAYIKNLRLGIGGNAFIIDDAYNVIASGVETQIGRNLDQNEAEELKGLLDKHSNESLDRINGIKETFKLHKELKEKVFFKMTEGESGSEQYIDVTGKHLELVSFYPIHIKGDTWSFAVETPYTFVTDTLKGSFVRTLALITLFILILLLNFIYIIYNYKKRIIAEVEVEHVSELFEKEHQLRKTEYKYKQLYQGIKEIILICASDFTIEEINIAGTEFLQRSVNQIAGKVKFQDMFISEADFKEFIEILKKNGNVRNFLSEVSVKEEPHSLEIGADKYYDEKEKKSYIYFVIRDITERKKFENEMIEKEKLESAMALVVTANHEINNPLAGIILNIDLIKNSVKDEDMVLMKYINDIARDVYRISGVLEKLRSIDSIKKTNYTGGINMIDIRDD